MCSVCDEIAEHESREWDSLSAAEKDAESIKATMSALMALDTNQECPREAVKSLARIFLTQDELNELAGGDPLPQKMKRIKELRP